jgi:Rrf2 family protein
MIALTKKCKYALRALYFLAREYDKGPILTHRISSEANVPGDFLETILLDLKHAGIVASRRGRDGGYMLVIPPERVTLGSIIRIVDGPLATLPCLKDNASLCEDCRDAPICQTRLLMQEVQRAAAAIVDKTTLLSTSLDWQRVKSTFHQALEDPVPPADKALQSAAEAELSSSSTSEKPWSPSIPGGTGGTTL